jgi:predicted CXXCH cytochrome family protein
VSTDGGHAFESISRLNNFEFADGGAIARASEVHPDTQTMNCAQCHMRRRALLDDGAPVRELLDGFEPELMTRGAFEPTGAMREEVFESASFLMSKMERAGVRCSHCHEPHSGELRAKGNALCAQCHAPNVFDVVAHRGNSNCVDCHMPTKTFLGRDKRRDHAFIVPGRAAPAFAEAFERNEGANELLLIVIRDANESSFKRASVLALLEPPLDRAAQQLVVQNLTSDDDWLRYGAVSALPVLPPEFRQKLGTAMLNDSRRAIRVRVARAIGRATPELLAAERANSFSGDSWLNLGALEADSAKAEALYRRGLEIDPAFVPLAINLADVSGDEGPLREAAREDSPWTNDARYALGLAQWRRGEKRAALENFKDGGSDAQLVAWCLAERELNGIDAGWNALTQCDRARPRSGALSELREAWFRARAR